MIEPPDLQTRYYSVRSTALDFHYRQGHIWLEASAGGKHSTPLAYAAFEFRLGMERVAVELLLKIGGTGDAKLLLKASRTLKGIKKRILQLGGRQVALDRHIEFMNCVLVQAGATFQLAKVNVATLSRLWEECSEFCHVNSTFALVSSDSSVKAAAFGLLQEADGFLEHASSSLIGWSEPHEPWFADLQRSYVAGEIGELEVTEKLRTAGVWGIYTAPDGTTTFASDLQLRSR